MMMTKIKSPMEMKLWMARTQQLRPTSLRLMQTGQWCGDPPVSCSTLINTLLLPTLDGLVLMCN